MIAILFTLLIICIVAIIGLYFRLNRLIKDTDHSEFLLIEEIEKLK